MIMKLERDQNSLPGRMIDQDFTLLPFSTMAGLTPFAGESSPNANSAREFAVERALLQGACRDIFIVMYPSYNSLLEDRNNRRQPTHPGELGRAVYNNYNNQYQWANTGFARLEINNGRHHRSFWPSTSKKTQGF